ncbi:alpha/beta hydrolase family protein [Chryseosolibacter indicus]|uniref:Dienelactone hydrolase family protein n=1 Tax=Chryseosolibacter indicus TaxID=2782351 RepID=A0ABS5VK05_9BACT|nr:alpha/beta family hydrolase [Chryseosolibacter indicus]MBT1701778.1 dienelactone hydrolase family protein [Chryseosolibacter indicus]
MEIKPLQVNISDSIGAVSAEITLPREMRVVMTLAHGAGAGMNHSFMVKLTKALAEEHIGTVRFNFPYMEKGKKIPDIAVVAEKTVQEILKHVSSLYSHIPIVASGKSFGGRMTSQLLAKNPLPFVKAIVFFGFPLHPSGKPGTQRAEHLKEVKIPKLFLQGTNDLLAEFSLVSRVCDELINTTLIPIENADHSFKIRNKDAIVDLSRKTSEWLYGSNILSA